MAGTETIQAPSGGVSVKSLYCTEALIVPSGVFSVLGTSVVAGELTLNMDSTLTTDGTDAWFTAIGATTADGANLFAINGRTLELPSLASYDHAPMDSHCDRTLLVSGEGSVLDLSGLTSIVGPDQHYSWLFVHATGGGQLDLNGVTLITASGAIDAGVDVFAEGAGSTIDLSALETIESYVGHDGDTRVVASGGGTIELGAVSTTLTDVLVMAETGSLIDAGTLWLTGESTLSGAGTVSSDVVNAAGVRPGMSAGSLVIDGEYTQTAGGTLAVEIGGYTVGNEFDQLIVTGEATLDGMFHVSLIDDFMPVSDDRFPVMTFGLRLGDFATKTGLACAAPLAGFSTSGDYDVEVAFTSAHWDGEAGDGLWSTAANWAGDTLPGSGVDVVIDVPGDVTVTLNSGDIDLRSLICEKSLVVTASSLTMTDHSFVRGNFSLHGGATLTANGAAATIVADGPVPAFGGSLIALGGATISMPTLTNNYPSGGHGTIRADGAGSLIDLPALTSITGPTQNEQNLTFEAVAGGRVVANGLANITMPNGPGMLQRGIRMLADGAGSVLDISGLSEFVDDSDHPGSSIVLRNGGQVIVNSLTTVTAVSLQTYDGTAFSLPSLETYNSGASYQQADFLVADGSGSLLDLPALTTITGSPLNGSNLFIQALAGGYVNISAVTLITSQVPGGGTACGIRVSAEGTDSTIDLSALTEFLDDAGLPNSSIEQHDGGSLRATRIVAESVTRVRYRVLTLSGVFYVDSELDAGDNTDVSTLDKRGAPRIFDGDGIGTAAVDIGAVEFVDGLFAGHFTDSTDEGTLRAAIIEANTVPGDDTIYLATDITVGMSRLTITGGEVLTFALDERAGGVLSRATLEITDVLVADNWSYEAGTGIYNYGGDLTVVRCTFDGNRSDTGSGGAIFVSPTGSLDVVESTFSANLAGTGDHGGAICVKTGAQAAVTGSAFIDNIADDYGGAVHNSGDMTVTNCTFSGNWSTS